MCAVAETVGDRHQVLTDNQRELLELLLPKSDGRVGRNFSNNRLVVEVRFPRYPESGLSGSSRNLLMVTGLVLVG